MDESQETQERKTMEKEAKKQTGREKRDGGLHYRTLLSCK